MKFTSKEIQKIEKAYLRLKEGSPTDNLKNKKYKIYQGDLTVYDARGRTPFAREFFNKAFCCIPQDYDLEINIEVDEIKTDVIKEDGIIVSRNINRLFDIVPKLWLNKRNANRYLASIKQQQDEFEQALTRNDLIKLYDLSIRHLAFYADSFYPTKELAKSIKRDDFAVLFTPDYSSYDAIKKGLLCLAEQSFFGEKPSVESFIENAGYLAGDDIIRTSYETEDGVFGHIEEYKSAYSLEQILEEKENRRLNDAGTSARRADYIRQLPKTKKIHFLCELAKEISNYNELNRKIVKKSFQVIRDAFERQDIDVHKGTYGDLCRICDRNELRIAA